MHASSHPLTPLPLPFSQATLHAGSGSSPADNAVALGVPSATASAPPPRGGWFGGWGAPPAAPIPPPPSATPLHPALTQAAHRDPPMLLCAQSRQLMDDPVLAPDGFTYERAILELCFRFEGPYSPVTKHPFEGDVKDDKFLLSNNNIKRATEALRAWRADGSVADLCDRLRPAITDPSGQHHPMRQPMTLSDLSTVDASQLPSLFEQHPQRSPFTGQLWQRYYEKARCNRALQALSAAVVGFEPPCFPTQVLYNTWTEPQLELPPPSSRLAYRSFCFDYRGLTSSVGTTLGFVAGVGAGIGASVGSSFGGALCCPVCLGTWLTSVTFFRAVDYPAYLTAQRQAALLYEQKTLDAYSSFNAQRMAVDLPPVQLPMQR